MSTRTQALRAVLNDLHAAAAHRHDFQERVARLERHIHQSPPGRWHDMLVQAQRLLDDLHAQGSARSRPIRPFSGPGEAPGRRN